MIKKIIDHKLVFLFYGRYFRKTTINDHSIFNKITENEFFLSTFKADLNGFMKF